MNPLINEIIIKKSRFICLLYEVDDINIINNIINNLKLEYKRATHITYAYIINNHEKYFDDKEPKGSAGLPILNVLKRNNKTNTLAVVIRYYGGIKLGIGPLIRSYSKVVSESIKKN